MAWSLSSNAMLATAAQFGEWSGVELALTEAKLSAGYNQNKSLRPIWQCFGAKSLAPLEDGLDRYHYYDKKIEPPERCGSPSLAGVK